MKILLLGSDWHGGFTEYCRGALNDLGHDVKVFYYEKSTAVLPLWKKLKNRFYLHFRSLKNIEIRVNNSKMNSELLKEALSIKPDMILILKGETVFPETLAQIKSKLEVPIVSWWIDNPLLRNNATYILKSIPYIDHIYIFDSYYINDLLNVGFKKVSYLPFACDPSVHKSIRLTKEENELYSCDISFIGLNHTHREKILYELFDFNIKVWGCGWKKLKKISNDKIINRVVSVEEAVKIYNASKIVLNINHPQSKNVTNTRTFEAAGCGAFQLTENLPEMGKLFDLGKEAVCYKDIDDLKSLVKYYLENSKEREEIARRGQQRVYRDHTYKQRMREIIDSVKG